VADDPADPRNRRISLLLLEGRGAPRPEREGPAGKAPPAKATTKPAP
jgi:chemotaxis protein MotB